MIYSKYLFLTFLAFASNAAYASADSIQDKIDYYISQAQFDSAKLYIETQVHEADYNENVSALNYQLVKVLFIQSNYNEALKQAFNSLDEVEDEALDVKFNFMIGCIYSAISDYSKSIEYLDLVAQRSTDSSLTVKAHLLLADLHVNAGDSASASEAIKAAYAISSVSNLDSKIKSHVAMQYNFLSENYELCKQQNLAIITDTTSFLNAKSYAYSVIGDCLVKQDSLQKAALTYEEFLQLTFETKDPEQIKVAATKLIEVYEKIGNQEKANAYHKIYNEAENDTLSFSAEKYRDLYDIEKSRELNIVKSRNLRNYLVIGLGFLLLLLFGIYYYFKFIKKAPGKKIVVNNDEIGKIKIAVDQMVENQLYLTPNITRKSFCADSELKSERYLSHYINEQYEKSFSVFISDLRVDYAHNRMQNDSTFRNYRIEEIAKECGFGSKKSFERAFQAKFEQTPYKFILSITD